MPADEQTAYPSVWTRPPRRRRDQPALSREQIVSEAIRLLDADGVDALSMRKLGARLNAGATSMYSHVANKDELIELVVDEVHGEIEVPAASGAQEWREATEAVAHSLRATILRHPWLASLFGAAGMAYLGPNMMRLSDDMLGVLESAGFELDAADNAVSTVFAFVVGMATTEAAWLTTLARSGQGEQEWTEQVWPAAEAAVQPYPRLRRQYAAIRGADVRGARVDKFNQGLASVLDGLATRRSTNG
ncbi:TetR/AcrR family transcriptional regulator [Streptomyces albipurpureus]|uniref:TetR/AcrR family transcriptional regulator n=1 Tax=Streptomyces albipurpureus TaxID=2897419 RepID=A0ABT0USE1_9ACTN|nr:TetR/AcrR family transcriptional regulator [Streptomyces sp. CWNU-1]MCM2391364.1 TetR/AcrR family transcriptional regulator [Streptomyces sp. CWNU-1]